MRGWDPRLGQPADHQQLAQVPSVRAVALGALLGPPPGRGLGGLGEMHPRADLPQLPDHEPPPPRGPHRPPQLLPAKAAENPPYVRAMSRREPRPRDLAGRRIDPLGSDLRSMLIQSPHDRNPGPPGSQASAAQRRARAHEVPTRKPGRPRTAAGPPLHTPSLSTPAASEVARRARRKGDAAILLLSAGEAGIGGQPDETLAARPSQHSLRHRPRLLLLPRSSTG